MEQLGFCFDWMRNSLTHVALSRNLEVGTLRRYVQASEQVLRIPELELSWELMRMAVKFEEKIFITAESKDDYLHRISLKMVVMELKAENASATNQMPVNMANNLNSSD